MIRLLFVTLIVLCFNLDLALAAELKSLKQCQGVANLSKVKESDKLETECVKEMKLAYASIQQFMRHCGRYGIKVTQNSQTIKEISSSGKSAQQWAKRARKTCNSAVKKLNDAIPEVNQRGAKACAREMAGDIKSIKKELDKLEAKKLQISNCLDSGGSEGTGGNGTTNGTNGSTNGTNGSTNGTNGSTNGTNGSTNGTNGSSNGTNGSSNGNGNSNGKGNNGGGNGGNDGKANDNGGGNDGGDGDNGGGGKGNGGNSGGGNGSGKN